MPQNQIKTIESSAVRRSELPAAAPYKPLADSLPSLRRRLSIRQKLRNLHERRVSRSRIRMKKRKAALAISVSTLGFGAGGMVVPPELPQDEAAAALFEQTAEGRRHAATFRVSDELRDAMKQEEGIRYTVYRDVAGYPTVGIGHLVTPSDRLRVGQSISRERVLKLYEKDLRKAEKAVIRLAGATPLHQHEFDALVDLVFNVGEGNVSEDRSPRLNQAIANRDYEAIARELHYTTAAGRVAEGLIHRSERRTAIFQQAAYEDPRTA